MDGWMDGWMDVLFIIACDVLFMDAGVLSMDVCDVLSMDASDVLFMYASYFLFMDAGNVLSMDAGDVLWMDAGDVMFIHWSMEFPVLFDVNSGLGWGQSQALAIVSVGGWTVVQRQDARPTPVPRGFAILCYCSGNICTCFLCDVWLP